MSRKMCLLTTVLFCVPLLSGGCSVAAGRGEDAKAAAIVSASDATAVEHLAAREVRRYVYLRTGTLLPIVRSDSHLPGGTPLIIVGQKDRPAVGTLIAKDPKLASSVDSLKAQHYLLKTTNLGNRRVLLITGGDAVGTLYATYRFAEHLGVRFYLHGDTIPDERIAAGIPDLDERGEPLFDMRGIQPFHDFPEGPDWWNSDDYKAIIAQLPKLRMNFFGLHTYPQGGVGPEPAVWIGMPADFNQDGTVKFS